MPSYEPNPFAEGFSRRSQLSTWISQVLIWSAGTSTYTRRPKKD